MKTKEKRGAPPRYDDAFKAGAVKMVTEQGRVSSEVALDLTFCPTPGSADRQSRDIRCQRELEAKNRTLRKQLAEKDDVIDVLKKSVGIFSKP